MINIFRDCPIEFDCDLNHFHGRDYVTAKEVVIKKKTVGGKEYVYAEPSAQEGHYAFGGTILYTSNGVFPDFNTPIKLHDRRMWMES